VNKSPIKNSDCAESNSVTRFLKLKQISIQFLFSIKKKIKIKEKAICQPKIKTYRKFFISRAKQHIINIDLD